MAEELYFLTIAELSKLIAAKKLSPVELTKVYIDRVKELDGELNAFILLMEESALADAKKAEAEVAKSGWKGPLHGIPIGLKDIYNTKDVTTTGHSALFKKHVPTEDATTVRLLREAGAIIFGKLSTAEFAIGMPSFDLPWPPARNPWNLERQPGGSSSGSGAAMAAGLCAGTMGTDTGGSIRYPAAMCGIAGIKPTYGRVSRRGILPLSFTLDHGGPMCWTSEDCALMMQALSAYDPLDPGSADVPAPDYSKAIGSGIRGLRIGVVRHFYEKDVPAAPEVGAAIDAALPIFEKLGATCKDVTLAPLGLYNDLVNLIMRPEAFAIHERYLTKTPELYGEIAKRRIMTGAFVRADDYVNGLRQRALLVAQLAEVLKDVDVLVMPTWGNTAPAFEGDPDMMTATSYTRPFNVTGSPALSICSGYSSDGLPLSMQIVGRPFEDDLVLKVGDAFEKATAFRSVRPTFAKSIAVAAQ